jgi:hypothetical protein
MQAMGLFKHQRPRTPDQDAVVLTMDAKVAAEKLGRTIGAVHTHRYAVAASMQCRDGDGVRQNAQELGLTEQPGKRVRDVR